MSAKVHARLCFGSNFQYVATVRVRYGDSRESNFSGNGIYKKVAHKVGVKLLTKRAKAAAGSLAKRVEEAGADAISKADKAKLRARAVSASERQREQRWIAARQSALETVRGLLRAWPDMELQGLYRLHRGGYTRGPRPPVSTRTSSSRSSPSSTSGWCRTWSM